MEIREYIRNPKIYRVVQYKKDDYQKLKDLGWLSGQDKRGAYHIPLDKKEYVCETDYLVKNEDNIILVYSKTDFEEQFILRTE